MASVHIESITGQEPFTVTICDQSGNNCSLLGIIGANVPPEQIFNLPPNLVGVTAIILIISDQNNCSKLKVLECFPTCDFTISVNGVNCIFTIDASPITVTPTPTPTNIIVLLKDNIPGDWIGIDENTEDFIFIS